MIILVSCLEKIKDMQCLAQNQGLRISNTGGPTRWLKIKRKAMFLKQNYYRCKNIFFLSTKAEKYVVYSSIFKYIFLEAFFSNPHDFKTQTSIICLQSTITLLCFF